MPVQRNRIARMAPDRPPHIDYEALLQAAMRGLVRTVLQQVARTGQLPGEHHFYIAFNTQAPGVSISKRLKERYQQEMTIVLQHRFWDLHVFDDRFEVKLTFDSVPERLVVPFAAIKVFWDPSVPYGHQFEESELVSEASKRLVDGPGTRKAGDPAEPQRGRPGPRVAGEKRRTQGPRRGKSDTGGAPPEGVEPAGNADPVSTGGADPAGEPAPPLAPLSPVATANQEPVTAPAEAKVISLDKFRKK